jgi:hypothetical protein
MQKNIPVIARGMAILFAIFFVVTSIMALPLTIMNRKMFNAELYKTALIEQNIYFRLPEIVGEALTGGFSNNPCAQNALACSIDGASPELKACLTTALGSSAYQAIGSGQRNPTGIELQLAQPCLDQFGLPEKGGSLSGSGISNIGGGMPPFFQNLTAADWQTMLTILLPADDLRTMTESMLDQMVAYLNGQTDIITVPLDNLKEHLMGAAGADLIIQLIGSKPPCTNQDLTQMLDGTINGDMVLVLCKPPEFILSIEAYLLPEFLKSVVPQIPNIATIIEPPAVGVPPLGIGAFAAEAVTTIRTLRLIMHLSPILPLVFLLLLTLLVVRSIKGLLQWWGISISISAAITLVLAFLALPAFNAGWTIFIIPRIPPYIPAIIVSIGQELLRFIIHSITNEIVTWSIIFFVPALAAWSGSYFIKSKAEPDAIVTSSRSVP